MGHDGPVKSGAQRRAVTAGLLEVGGMGTLLGQALARGVRPPFDFAPELISELRVTMRTCLPPLVLVAFALSFGPAGVQGTNFFGLFGSYDRMGAIWQIIVTREFGPLTTAIVLAGAAGTAVCSDLGARVVRDEIAALNVLGIDTIKALVLPRLLVMAGCAMLFYTFALIAGLAGAALVLVQHGQRLSPFFSVFLANASLVELVAAFAKVALFGATIAVVCCYKGLKVSGGAESVGRAVNQAVVISFLAIAAIDYAFGSLLLASHPILSQPKG